MVHNAPARSRAPQNTVPDSQDVDLATENVRESVRRGLQRLEESAHALALQGWVIPMDLTPAETHEILSLGTTEAVDQWFIDYYGYDSNARFESLATFLESNDNLLQWRALLTQALAAYRRHHYAVTVPALLVVIEGLIAANGNTEIRVKQMVAAQVKSQNERWRESIRALIWRTLSVFVGELYKHRNFKDARPPIINRHWILHGRDESTWGQADCLRLIQAIETFSHMLARGV